MVVNNAGRVRQAPFEDFEPGLADVVFDSQLGGPFNVTRPAWRVMKERGYGRVLNVSSGAGLWGVANMAAYGAAKMAVVGLTRVLAVEGAPLGINVNVIAPNAKTRPGGFGPVSASEGLHEWLSVDKIAPLVAWLVHEDCHVSGECFTVGGGYVGHVVLTVPDLSPENVRDHFDTVMADGPLHGLDVGTGDVARVMEGYDA